MLRPLTDLPVIAAGPLPPPGPRDVHIWRHNHGADINTGHMEELLALLSPDERKRAARLSDDRRLRHFVTGRGLCRRVLSFYAPVAPEDWRFTLGSRGKPSISAPVLTSPLWFSLSHADNVSVCAVTGAGPEFGIDIERIAHGKDGLAIAEQFFPAADMTALRRLPQSRQGEAFVRLWALKESFVKACETSLTDGLSATAFDLSRPNDISVAFTEPLREKADQWRFRLFCLNEELILALAVRAQAVWPLRLSAGISDAL
jgi:4'-phosphopantetheinyl transferase